MKRSEHMTFGQRFHLYRKNIGYTQNEVAEYLMVTPQAVSKWENDLGYPDISLLVPISELFEISTDELLGHAKKSDEDIRASLFELRYHDEGDAREKYSRCLDMLAESPNNPDILKEVMERICMLLVSSENPIGADKKAVLLTEGEKFATRLREKTDIPSREIDADSYLFSLYYSAKEREKAAKIAARMPVEPRYTRNRLLGMLAECDSAYGDATEHFKASIESALIWLFWDMERMAQHYRRKEGNREKAMSLYKLSYDMIRVMYGESFELPYPLEAYYQNVTIRLAQDAAFGGDSEKVFHYLDEHMAVTRARLKYAKEPISSSSLLVRDAERARVERYHANAAKASIHIRFSWKCFDHVRDDKRFKAYLEEVKNWGLSE